MLQLYLPSTKVDQSAFRYHKVDLRTITLGVPPQEVWCSYLAFVTIPNSKIYNNIEHGDFVHSNYLVTFNLPSKLHCNWDALVFYKSMSPFWQMMYLIWIWERWCKICRRICIKLISIFVNSKISKIRHHFDLNLKVLTRDSVTISVDAVVYYRQVIIITIITV